MLSAFVLSMPKRPSIDELTEYYSKAMMTRFMGWLCRQSGKKNSPQRHCRNEKNCRIKSCRPQSVLVEYGFCEYSDGSGYEGRFTKCGICVLMKELGLFDLTPAMCRLDYTMSEAGGATNFVRRYTIASGGSYCDCGYKKKI